MRHIDILRETADIPRALFDLFDDTSTRWYQLLSAGKNIDLFLKLYFSYIIGGVYGGAATIRARLLPFLSVEQSYLNGLLSNTGSDVYPLAWWRYPYAHLRTETEFNSLANEYENSLSQLESDLQHANVDNARLEAE